MGKNCINCNASIGKFDVYKKLSDGTIICYECFEKLSNKSKSVARSCKKFDSEVIIKTIDDRTMSEPSKKGDKRIKIFLLLVILFVIKSCFFSDSKSEDDLLSYTILKNDEIKLSTVNKYFYDILILEKEFNEEDLRYTMDYLYEKYSDEKPDNSSFFINAYTSKEKFEYGSDNILASLNKVLDNDIEYYSSKQEFNSLKEIKRIRWGLSYGERQEIYLITLYIEHLINNFKRYNQEFNVEYDSKNYSILKTYLTTLLISKHKVRQEIIDNIRMEANEYGWVKPNNKYFKKVSKTKFPENPEFMKGLLYYDLKEDALQN